MAATVLVIVAVVAVAALVRSADAEGASSTPTTPRSTPSSSTTSTPTAGDQPAPPGTTEHSFRQGILNREYTVIAPDNVDESKRLPVVMILHGLATDRFAAASQTGLKAAVNEHGFIAVLPQGVANSWNAGPCCPPATLARIDDAGFLDRVLSEVRARADVDPERTYLMGFSNGGLLTYSQACARPGTFTKIAVVAGVNLSGCAPKEPVPLLHLHGNPDRVVPYDGAFTPSQLLASADIPPVPDSVAAWAKAENCEEPPTEQDSGGVQRRRWSRCDGSATVELVTYPGNGHTWPTTPVDGLAEILAFFDLD
ncbi:MAG: alpha/beta hydrolase family esterase [Acidimicrobiales bacterium]